MKPKIKETKSKTEVQPIKPVELDGELLAFVKTNHEAGVAYRNSPGFKKVWDRIIGQIRCAHPAEWDEKEDWQSKVFIPQQAKKSETAFAYLDKMLFGQKRFYNIGGVEKNDKEEAGYIAELYDVLFDRGNFFFENDFILHESVDIGTGFIKMLVKPDQSGIDFIWRSAYNISFDPTCGYKWNPKFVCDEYKKTLPELVASLDAPNPLYTKEAIQKVIEMGMYAGQGLADEDLMTVKNIDGTAQVKVSKDWYEVSVVEYWGKVKESFAEEGKPDIKKFRVVDKIITTVNDAVVIRNVPNEYGFIPIRPCRVKPRLYDTYGLGFLENCQDLQDLANSIVNLGFDSLKLCSMDIAVVDATKIKDPASIEYRPMATWYMKGDPRQSVLLTRQGISALGQIMQGLTLIDQFDQEASGVLRQVQGSPELGANGGGDETLGQYQAKLAMIDNRFLKIGRFIERDYVEPLLKDIFKIIFNPKFFNQNLLDRILGFKEVIVDGPEIDPLTQQPIKVKQILRKLDFDKISKAGDMAYDFKAVGMTQFSKAMETLSKLKELLLTVVKTPQLAVLSRVDEIFKRVLQAAEIGDYQDLIKSDEEIRKIMEHISGGIGQPQAPGGVPIG